MLCPVASTPVSGGNCQHLGFAGGSGVSTCYTDEETVVGNLGCVLLQPRIVLHHVSESMYGVILGELYPWTNYNLWLTVVSSSVGFRNIYPGPYVDIWGERLYP